VSKRLGSRYVSRRTRDWLNFKNAAAPAVHLASWNLTGNASG